MILSSNFPDYLDENFRKWFSDSFGERAMLYDTLYGIENSTRSQEKVTGMSGIDSLLYTPHGAAMPSDEPIQLWDKTFTHIDLSRTIAITEQMIDDDRSKDMKDMVRALGKAARRTIEQFAACLFNNAFTTTAIMVNGYSYDPTGPDGKALCADDHPTNPDDTTANDNKATLALSFDNLIAVHDMFAGIKDERGTEIDWEPDILLVPPELSKLAEQITKGPFEIDTTSNLNVFLNKVVPIEWHYLTDSNAWFLIDSGYMKEFLTWYWRKPVEFDMEEVKINKIWRWFAAFRASFGFSNCRWIVGSNPS